MILVTTDAVKGITTVPLVDCEVTKTTEVRTGEGVGVRLSVGVIFVTRDIVNGITTVPLVDSDDTITTEVRTVGMLGWEAVMVGERVGSGACMVIERVMTMTWLPLVD